MERPNLKEKTKLLLDIRNCRCFSGCRLCEPDKEMLKIIEYIDYLENANKTLTLNMQMLLKDSSNKIKTTIMTRI